MRVAFLGFGLVGGSIALALRAGEQQPDLELVAWTPGGVGPAQGVRDGVLTLAAASAAESIDGADLIVLAAPPLDCLDWLDELGGPLRGSLKPDATITDVASTKAALMTRAAAHALPFVGGHPMAGLELSGYGAATADLFTDRPWVVVPGETASERGIAAVEALALACGARPRRMDAAMHDAAVAGTSHLPLILAAALVEAVAGPSAEGADRPFVPGLTAGGWRDMTRLARGDVRMGSGIVATNGPSLAARIRDLQAVLAAWLAEVDGPGDPDPASIDARLQAARDRLEELDHG